jgi:hypothetical protein
MAVVHQAVLDNNRIWYLALMQVRSCRVSICHIDGHGSVDRTTHSGGLLAYSFLDHYQELVWRKTL